MGWLLGLLVTSSPPKNMVVYIKRWYQGVLVPAPKVVRLHSCTCPRSGKSATGWTLGFSVCEITCNAAGLFKFQFLRYLCALRALWVLSTLKMPRSGHCACACLRLICSHVQPSMIVGSLCMITGSLCMITGSLYMITGSLCMITGS